MLIQTFLIGFVVVRRNGQNAADADFFKLAHHMDDVLGVVAAGARDYRNAAFGLIDGDLANAQMFRMFKRRTLTGGAAGHKEVDAAGNLALYQGAQRGFIQGKVSSKRSNKGCAAAGKHSASLIWDQKALLRR